MGCHGGFSVDQNQLVMVSCVFFSGSVGDGLGVGL